MALYNNLISNSLKDINLYLRNFTKDFLNFINYINNFIFNLLANNKKPHKYAFICLCYNQQNHNKLLNWKSLIQKSL